VKASVLYTEDVQVQALPALRKGSSDDEETEPAHIARAVSSVAESPTFNRLVRGPIPRRPTKPAPLAQWIRAARFYRAGRGFESSMARGPLDQRQIAGFSAQRLRVQISYGLHHGQVPGYLAGEPRPAVPLVKFGPIVYGLGSGVFTPGNGVRLSVGLQRSGLELGCQPGLISPVTM
jgi:hypothetical protein